MHLDVDTEALRGVADVVRRAASATEAVPLPRAPACGDVAVTDAVGALLEVCGEQLGALAGVLRGTAVLVETARHDYARTESAAASE